MKEHLKVLIPAAGFGRRVGSPEAKEMLPDPQGQPLIAAALDLALGRGWDVVVATRAEKKSLVQYLENRGVEILLLEPTQEWPQTVLKTKSVWREWNLLLLPDCRFQPEVILDEIWAQAQKSKARAYAGVFKVDSGRKWGCLRQNREGRWSIAEKPLEQKPELAWGIWLFHKDVGEELFQRCFDSQVDHSWQSLSFDLQTVELESFKDLTRD